MGFHIRKSRVTIHGQPVHQPDAPTSDIEMARIRLIAVGLIFLCAWLVIAGRLGMLTFSESPQKPAKTTSTQVVIKPGTPRATITDRNGQILATSLATASLFADPRNLPDADEATTRLVETFPDLDRDDVFKKLSGKQHFVWIKRNLTPRQQADVLRLGIPGLDFQKEERRVYPAGNLTAHIVGYTDIDGNGIAGIEKSFNDELATHPAPLRLSLDLRIQSILHEEIRKTIKRFSALGGSGLVLDTRNGEIIAMASLPDFDPHDPGKASDDARFNRASLGVYEMGSTFKMFTAAAALESGQALPTDLYDARKPLKVDRFTIRDSHPESRWLSMPEVIMYSSNIGAAQIALQTTTPIFRAYLEALGLTQRAPVELPEVGAPLVPSRWRDINTMTIAFGHGLAVNPIQMASAFSAVITDGILHAPTLVAGKNDNATSPRIFSEKTVMTMRKIARLVVSEGTGKQAAAEGYVVGGKTGTAEKAAGRGYNRKANLSSFLSAFPMQDPRYVLLVSIDEPKGIPETYGFTTGGWVAAPAIGEIIGRMAPLLGIRPFDETAPEIASGLYIDPAPTKGGRQIVVF